LHYCIFISDTFPRDISQYCGKIVKRICGKGGKCSYRKKEEKLKYNKKESLKGKEGKICENMLTRGNTMRIAGEEISLLKGGVEGGEGSG
jgi:hypothetical protein